MPVECRSTLKMEHGKTSKTRMDTLEQRRTVWRYELPDGHRQFPVRLSPNALGLPGKLIF